MGKESEKEWTYVYAQQIHFAVHLKLTQHCKSTILQTDLKKIYFFKRMSPSRFLNCQVICHKIIWNPKCLEHPQKSPKQNLSRHHYTVIIHNKDIWWCLKEKEDLGTAGLRKKQGGEKESYSSSPVKFFSDESEIKELLEKWGKVEILQKGHITR